MGVDAHILKHLHIEEEDWWCNGHFPSVFCLVQTEQGRQQDSLGICFCNMQQMLMKFLLCTEKGAVIWVYMKHLIGRALGDEEVLILGLDGHVERVPNVHTWHTIVSLLRECCGIIRHDWHSSQVHHCKFDVLYNLLRINSESHIYPCWTLGQCEILQEESALSYGFIAQKLKLGKVDGWMQLKRLLFWLAHFH